MFISFGAGVGFWDGINALCPKTKIEAMVEPSVRIKHSSGTIIRSYEAKGENWCYVLTAYHVVEDMPNKSKIPCEFRTWRKEGRFSGRIHFGVLLEHDEKLDFAIIGYKTHRLMPSVKCVPYESDYNLFDTVYTVGCPNYQPVWVTEGNLAGINCKTGMNRRAFGYTGGGWHGSSGGGLFDEEYRQIGITTEISMYHFHKISSMMFAIPLRKIYSKLGKEKTSQYFNVR